MATIQIRDLPEETYEKMRRRARLAGQSIQAYMRDQVIQLADRRSKEELWAAVESGLDGEPGVADRALILTELDADRK